MTAFADYLDAIKKNLAHGDATEQTHRTALKQLLEASLAGIVATNEPKRILCGAPDFSITRKKVPLGHVETKRDRWVDRDPPWGNGGSIGYEVSRGQDSAKRRRLGRGGGHSGG